MKKSREEEKKGTGLQAGPYFFDVVRDACTALGARTARALTAPRTSCARQDCVVTALCQASLAALALRLDKAAASVALIDSSYLLQKE